MRARVLDENASPTLRRLIGRLLLESERVDLALTRIRLAALDLTDDEIDGPSQCRVLIGRLDAATLLDAAPPTPGAPGAHESPRPRLDALRRLDDWIRSGRLAVRSAGIGAWTPDFSLFTRTGGTTCLLGAHYFGHPQLTVGPSITVVTDSVSAASLLAARYEELWARAHDVAPAISEVMGRAIAGAAGPVGGRRGGAGE